MILEEFLALPGAPCIRVRVAPMGQAYDELEVDQAVFEERKDELRDYCHSLGDVTAYDWRAMRQFTDGNGQMAKLLIVLGELAGAWEMYPPLENSAGLWNKDHPRVFRMKVFEVPRLVPKPSAGDLETNQVCFCCERPMGPTDSRVHDLVASPSEPKMCVECIAEGCELEGDCHVFPEKKAEERQQRRAAAEEDESDGPPPGLEAYLKQFE